jgi:hypothetical protein
MPGGRRADEVPTTTQTAQPTDRGLVTETVAVLGAGGTMGFPVARDIGARRPADARVEQGERQGEAAHGRRRETFARAHDSAAKSYGEGEYRAGRNGIAHANAIAFRAHVRQGKHG